VVKIDHTFAITGSIRTDDSQRPYTAAFDVCNEHGEIMNFHLTHGKGSEEIRPFIKDLAERLGSGVRSCYSLECVWSLHYFS
jgi:hypothetical protein